MKRKQLLPAPVTITRYGLEEYVADCVIPLDHRVAEQIRTRRLRVLKYRGTAHGTNEYPFIIPRPLAWAGMSAHRWCSGSGGRHVCILPSSC